MNKTMLSAILISSLSFSAGLNAKTNSSFNTLFSKFSDKEKTPSGRYSGVLSDANGRLIGALQISLSQKVLVDQSGSLISSVLANIQYVDNSTSFSIESSNSNFDQSTGIFTATIQVPTSNSTGQLYLTAKITDKNITNGQIQSATSASNILHFSLIKNGRTLKEQVTKYGSAFIGLAKNEVTSYMGTTTFQNGKTKPVKIQILRLAKGTAEDLAALIAPSESVSLNLDYGNGISLMDPNAIRDRTKGYVLASSTLNNSTGSVAVLVTNCTFTNQEKAIQCIHSSNNNSNGNNANSKTTAVLAQNDENLPVDGSDLRTSSSKTFKAYRADQNGNKISEVEAGGNLSSEVDLMITVLPKSRGDEMIDLFLNNKDQNVVATVIAYADDQEASVAIPIQNTAWDQDKGTLNGSGSIFLASGTTATVTLDCAQFKPNMAFVCDYVSNANGAHIHFVGSK